MSNPFTREWYARHLAKRNSNSGHKELHPVKPEPDQRPALESPLPGKDQIVPRFKIVFRIFAVRPLDWDNNGIKALQDALIKSGILHDDKWNVLWGEIQPNKVENIEEEKTEITIYRIE